MKKINDFAILLKKYFNSYLVNDRGCSPQTISTYRYAFIQFIDYMEIQNKQKPEHVDINSLNAKNVELFLSWLEVEYHISISTRNLRLAAIKGFAVFIKYERPEYIANAVDIQNIKAKKQTEPTITYLKPEGIKLLLKQIDKSTDNGMRDYNLILLLFLTGIRVSELITIRGRDISLSAPKTILIHGKGGKLRHVAIVKQLSVFLENYLNIKRCMAPENLEKQIFTNHSGDAFTRQGINYILKKYAEMAREKNPNLIPKDCSPHKIRHSTAVALVEQGTDLIVIRDLLGHTSVQTTEIYAKVSTERRRKAIEEAAKDIVAPEVAKWDKNESLKEWLKNYGKQNIM